MNAQQKRKLKREQQAKLSKLMLDKFGIVFKKSEITDSMLLLSNENMPLFVHSVKQAIYSE